VPDAADRLRVHPARVVAPLDDAELKRLADTAFAGTRSVLIAVSGGADSMALMLLAARWLALSREPAPQVHVATVDHGLRPNSADEAAWVARQSAALGFPHHCLVWADSKPTTGVQAAARAARYALLIHLVHRLPLPAAIAMGHHQDDQAETLLMRLARGSGLDGLAAMRPVRPIADGPPGQSGSDICIVRPFLSIPKARLTATLRQSGMTWLEDPSNISSAFERPRLRKALAELDKAGVTRSAIALSAGRLGRARAALEALTNDLADRVVETNDGAYGRVAAAAFDAAPAELRLRLLQRLLRWYGGASGPPRMAKLEALLDRLVLGAPITSTLAGCQIRRTRDCILATREPGRRGLPVLTIAPGATATWDTRYIVCVGQSRPGPVTVKALPAEVLERIIAERRGDRSTPLLPLPRSAALTLPSLWDGERLLAIPHPAFASSFKASDVAAFTVRLVADLHGSGADGTMP